MIVFCLTWFVRMLYGLGSMADLSFEARYLLASASAIEIGFMLIVPIMLWKIK